MLRRVPRLALLAQAGAITFLTALLVLHALTLRSLPWYMSEYANSPYRPIFLAGGYAFALALAAAALGLSRTLPHTKRILTGITLLAAVVPFAFLAATFPVDDGDSHSTVSGQVHDWSTIPMFLFLNAALLLLHPALRLAHSKTLARATLAAGLIAAGAEIVYLIARFMDVPIVAVAQRVLVAVAIGWCILVAQAMRQGSLTGPVEAEVATSVPADEDASDVDTQ